MVEEFQLKPLTAESEAVWATRPLEFFAEVSALALTEPDVLERVSSALREWMRLGGYRVL
ncbi:hypothetical protein GCM10023205_83400 [Yinghuangia aomiensis]|uniref:Uncharacterized protein n=1 Tax=Yinghuangia aomiensis TaxID=676205 RepID=A0ABP9IG99_9ACTN